MQVWPCYPLPTLFWQETFWQDRRRQTWCHRWPRGRQRSAPGNLSRSPLLVPYKRWICYWGKGTKTKHVKGFFSPAVYPSILFKKSRDSFLSCCLRYRKMSGSLTPILIYLNDFWSIICPFKCTKTFWDLAINSHPNMIKKVKMHFKKKCLKQMNLMNMRHELPINNFFGSKIYSTMVVNCPSRWSLYLSLALCLDHLVGGGDPIYRKCFLQTTAEG